VLSPAHSTPAAEIFSGYGMEDDKAIAARLCFATRPLIVRSGPKRRCSAQEWKLALMRPHGCGCGFVTTEW